jgi:AcrR family transcriptional regulator
VARQTSADTSDGAVRGRQATEFRLLEATLRLLERDGVLAGLNLQEVADEAGVNRGNIYLYFGSRRELLRRALAAAAGGVHEVMAKTHELPFIERRLEHFRMFMQSRQAMAIPALLALEGDEDFLLMPRFDESRAELETDQADGRLHADADLDLVHVVPLATMLGYAIFREAFARETGTSIEDLDKRAEAIFRQMLEGLTGKARKRK